MIGRRRRGWRYCCGTPKSVPACPQCWKRIPDIEVVEESKDLLLSAEQGARQLLFNSQDPWELGAEFFID